MKRVLILVEGPTERDFVRKVLAPDLSAKDILLLPTILITGSDAEGKFFRGGSKSFAHTQKEIRRLLGDHSADLVTTFFDFYGLRRAWQDFPGWKSMASGTCYQQVEHVETVFEQQINSRRFLPYIALHEFEAMLFASPEAIFQAFPDSPRRKLEQLLEVRRLFESPEEINHDQPPSIRLSDIIPGYNKVLFGSLIPLDIGLDNIRAACPHFDDWLQGIEKLAEAE